MAAFGSRSNLPHEERIARKKRVVNELLALRRMKQQQLKDRPFRKTAPPISPNTGRLYEAYKVFDESSSTGGRVTVSRDQVRGLMKGTVLEKELTATYGRRGVDDAAASYVREMSNGETFGGTHDPYGQSAAEQRLFMHKLMKERKLKLDALKQKRLDKEQALLEQKARIRLAKIRLRGQNVKDNGEENHNTIESDSSDENMNALVNEVKQNIAGLEKNIKRLRQNQRTRKNPQVVFRKPPAIDYEFKPWQDEQVKIATEVVNDVINRALDICVYSEDNLGSKLLEALLKTDNEAWEKVSEEEIKRDSMLEILQDLQEEVTSVIVQKVVNEFVVMTKLIDVLSADLVINSPYTALNGKPPKDAKDSASQLVDKMWVDMMSHRARARKNLWSHTQGVVATVVPSATSLPQEPQTVAVVEENEGDVTPLSYELTPISRGDFAGGVWDKYVEAEFTQWESSTVAMTSNAFPMSYRRTVGISCLSISYDNVYVALGTYHGDILIYDTKWQPFRPIRCVSFVGKKTEPIAHIAWSHDQSRILSLSDSHCLILWSVAYASPSSSSDLRHLGIIPENSKDDGYECNQLTALAILEANQNDFAIIEGPLATTVSKEAFLTPILAQFSPDTNAAGSQNVVVIGFATGDIVRLDLTMVIASRMCGLLDYHPQRPDIKFVNGRPMLSKGNKILNGVEMELFRSHRNPILMIHFVSNRDEMLTMDRVMNICIWKHDDDHFTGFNWFTPYRKLRLTGTEVVMVPKGQERLFFEDEITLKKQKRGKKRKGKQEVERERREAQMELQALQLQRRRPWHSDDQDEDEDGKKKKNAKFITKMYAPTQKEILDPSADQLFHIVTKQRSTNLLVKYATRVYSVSRQVCKALIGIQPSYDGKKLYFMFLYEKHPPNVKPHVTFVDLDLTRLDMLQSMVIKVDLDQSEYEEITTSKRVEFAVTRKYALPYSEYIYATIAGKMHVFSADTRSEVAWCAPGRKSKKSPPENGLELPPKLGKTTQKFKLAAVCPDGNKTFVIFQYLKENRSREAVTSMITVENQSSVRERESLLFLSKQLKQSQEEMAPEDEEKCPPEQCVYFDRYTSREMPLELYLKMTINSMIDNAVAAVTGERITNEQRVKLWAMDWEKMQEFFDVH